MEKIINSFITAKFDVCLKHLTDIKLRDGSACDVFVLENNKAVCQSLLHLAEGNVKINDQKEFLRIWSNCVGCGPPNEVLPLNLELVLLENLLLVSLFTLDISNHSHAWESAFTALSETCKRITGVLVPQTTNSYNLDEAIDSLNLLRESAITKYPHCSAIILETIIVSLLIILRTSNPINFTTISSLIRRILKDSTEFKALRAETPSNGKSIFKLGIFNSHSTLEDIDVNKCLECLSLLGNICLVQDLSSFKYEALELDQSSVWISQWRYCRAFYNYKSGNRSEALGLLLMGLPDVQELELRGRYCCLLGRVYSALGEHMKAVDYLTKATGMISDVAVVHYLQGFEHGKMGLHDLMLRSYRNLAKVMKKKYRCPSAAPRFSFDSQILKILHNSSEINKVEATYVLAVAYALNERFEEAMHEYETLLTPDYYSTLITSHASQSERIVKIPQIIVILHEAATIFLLNGRLSRAEEVCRQAMGSYFTREGPSRDKTDTHGTKDSDWLRTFLAEELNIAEEKTPTATYFENYISFFDEDVIGLMLLAEIHKIQQLEEARLTLNQTLLLLSKHMARMQKETKVTAEEQSRLSLVKALTCKICLHVAKMQENSKSFQDVDRMYKRALSCNNGDKDVLYKYGLYLMREKKREDAEKLWKTFFGKESVVKVEECQSLSLRYLLRTEVSRTKLHEFEIQLNVNR